MICCSLIIALILSGVAVTQSRDVMLSEVKKELLYASQKYANQFSTQFNTQENIVDLMCAVVSADFTAADYQNDRSQFLARSRKLNELIRSTMKEFPESQSLYFTFNPDTSGANDEIWFLRNDENEIYFKEADSSTTDWLVDDGNENDAYYFDAVRTGKKWSGVEFDKYLNNYSVTYSRSCLDKNGQLIGVMGSDIFINNILNEVGNIKLEEGGCAFLLDKDYQYLAGSESEAQYDAKYRRVIREVRNDPNTGKREVNYSVIDGIRYLTTYSTTYNGWILALIQSEETLLQPIHQVKQILFSMAAMILAGVIAYTFYFFKKSLAPIVKEFEMKDVIMLHQSRQAKLGEMVGNIAHQWKQPLNVMSITLSNLWDDFSHDRLTEEQMKDHIDDMRTYIRNMSATVDDFADFLKPVRKKEVFSVEETIDTALGLMQESIKINRITVTKDITEDHSAVGYKNEFCQAIFNILNNARDAIISSGPEKREIRIIIRTSETEKGGTVIDICNNGEKIPPETLVKLFQPYFTTKETSGGTGIGLYLTKDILESHFHGTIRLFNIENGVCCRVTIPGRHKHD
jgi:signal transduction histidine kinase